jgi:hypothetical protein
MSRLLRDLDYLRVIQSDNLAQIIENNQQVKLDVEQAAQAEMISYLEQRYIKEEIFSNTTVYDNTATYYAKNLVEYTETVFNALSVYNPGDRITFTTGSGDNALTYVYECVTLTTAGQSPTTTPAKWDQLCLDKSLFYVTLPEEQWNPETEYVIGDEVWYDDKVYTALVANTNVKTTVSAVWGSGVSYSISGDLPTDTTKWTAGDNRNQLIVLHLIDITLYHLHRRINPRNVPDHRKEAYNGNSHNDCGGAIGWLKRVAKGSVNADLPEINPEQGMAMRSGNANDSTTSSRNMLW